MNINFNNEITNQYELLSTIAELNRALSEYHTQTKPVMSDLAELELTILKLQIYSEIA